MFCSAKSSESGYVKKWRHPMWPVNMFRPVCTRAEYTYWLNFVGMYVSRSLWWLTIIASVFYQPFSRWSWLSWFPQSRETFGMSCASSFKGNQNTDLSEGRSVIGLILFVLQRRTSEGRMLCLFLAGFPVPVRYPCLFQAQQQTDWHPFNGHFVGRPE